MTWPGRRRVPAQQRNCGPASMPRGTTPVGPAWDASGQLTVLVADAPEIKAITDHVGALEGTGCRLAGVDEHRLVLYRRLVARSVEPVAGILRRLSAGDRGRVSVSVHVCSRPPSGGPSCRSQDRGYPVASASRPAPRSSTRVVEVTHHDGFGLVADRAAAAAKHPHTDLPQATLSI